MGINVCLLFSETLLNLFEFEFQLIVGKHSMHGNILKFALKMFDYYIT